MSHVTHWRYVVKTSDCHYQVSHEQICQVTCRNESWHTQEPRRATHMNESITRRRYRCVVQTSDCHYQLPHIRMNQVTCKEWVKAHVGTRRATHVNESWHMQEHVGPHMWMSHILRIECTGIESKRVTSVTNCHTYEWVKSHAGMGHVTHRNTSSHTYDWIISHVWYAGL